MKPASAPPLVLRREEIPRYGVVDRAYSVWIFGQRVGEVGRDDVEPGESGAARHLWHAWIDEIPGSDWDALAADEAVGTRAMTRREAVGELLWALAETLEWVGLDEAKIARELARRQTEEA